MNFKKSLNKLRNMSDDEVVTMVEKATGKELVSYEGIDALVAALMGFYNGELKKKSSTGHKHTKEEITDFPSTMTPSAHKHTKAEITDFTHNHDDRYYTESAIDDKFKNFCPFPIGGVLPMWNETNPTSLYLGTTWELISAGKYIQTGSTALQTGGSNLINLIKANLPNIKLSVSAHTHSFAKHRHGLLGELGGNLNALGRETPTVAGMSQWSNTYVFEKNGKYIMQESNISSGSSESQTETLGSGTSIKIQPSYITLKFWKRLS